MKDKDAKLIFDLRNTRPVELSELGKAFDSFAQEYKDRLRSHNDDFTADEVSLHVVEVRKGSIVAEISAMATYALPIAEHANTLWDFCTNLKSTLEWLKGKTSGKKPKLSREKLQNISNIVTPVVRDSGSQLNISGNVTINNPTIILTNQDASAVWHGAKRELALLSQRKAGVHEHVVVHWYQARYDPKSRHGDRAVIESIHSGPIRTIFSNDGVKAKMLAGNRNPFKMAFFVDVVVEAIEDRPVLYRIIEVYGPVK